MKLKLVSWVAISVLGLSACGGGSDSSGGIGGVDTILDCVIDGGSSTLSLEDTERCNFTADQVTSFPGFTVGIADCSIADQEFVVGGVTFPLTANEVTANGLNLECTP